MDDLFERNEFFGDPQPDVGCAGDDARVGVLRIKLRQRLFACRCSKKRTGIADKKIGLVVERANGCQPRRGIAAETIVGRPPQTSRAASTIGRYPVQRHRFPASTSLIVVAARSAVAFVIMGEQAHHDTRRAKAALRAMLTAIAA